MQKEAGRTEQSTRGGIVDDRFLNVVPHSRRRLGHRVHVSDADARSVLDAVENLCSAIDAALP